MFDIWELICVVGLFVTGALMFFDPVLCTKKEQRDDLDAVAKIKKCGAAIMSFATAAVFYVIKFKLL